MRYLFTLLLAFFLHLQAFAASGVWISLSGDVEPVMNDFVRRAISQARQENPDYILFEINTFGGRLDAAFDIVDTILGIKDIKTIAVVKNKAISAGSLTALTSNELYMMEGTTIGDCAPIVQGASGTPEIVGEKVQSPLRAKFRNLAQRNGYPELLSAAMVTPELEIYQLKNKDSVLTIESKNYEHFSENEKKVWGTPKVLVRAGELLTMTEKEALEFGFSKGTIASRKALEEKLSIEKVSEVQEHSGEKVARFISAISGLLLILGFGALYMEFKTPGFGIFGIIGIVAIALVFFGSQAGRIENFVPLILLIVGVVLFVLEIFVFPGTMVFGALGIVSMVIALALAFDFTTLPAFLPSLGSDISPILLALFYVLTCAGIALIIPLVFSKYIVPLLPEGYSPMLKTDLADSQSPTEEVQELSVGTLGVAKTFLRPVGHAIFEGKVIDVQTLDSEIEPGDKVEVVKIQDGRVFVHKV